MVKYNKDTFIAKSKEIHNNKYDYSKIDYKNCKTKICIICPEHGKFWQTPDKHINAKQGCPICAGKEKITNRKFIERARKIHGEKYDYSKIEYVNNSTKICIICPEHGEFWQTPANHLKGNNCPLCAGKIDMTTEDFIKKSKIVHGDKYDYSKTDLAKREKNKVIITCPKHGDFKQDIWSHLNGAGCKFCAGNAKKTTEQFIKEANYVHNNKYSYDKSIYTNNREKLIVTCPLHGDFLITPKHHLQRSQGCPICNASHLEEECRLSLENNKIEYIEKASKNIIPWIGRKHLDFYLPKYNIAIECQGEQHFKSVDAFGGLENLEKTIQRDKEKNIICKKNNVDLLYYTNKNFLSRNVLESFYENKIFSDINVIMSIIKHKNGG